MFNLRMLHWNSNGLANKSNEILALIQKLNIDIVLINETHLNPLSTLKLPNFLFYITDLQPIRDSPAHGGTAI